MKNIVPTLGLCTLVCSSILPAAASAQDCSSGGATVMQSGDLTYDPSEGRPLRVSVAIMGESAGDPACRAAPVAIETRHGGPFTLEQGGSVLPSSFTRTQNFAVSASDRLNLTATAISMIRSTGILQTDLITVAQGEFSSPGIYELQLNLVLANGETIPFEVAVTVIPSVVLLSTDGNQDIALGEVSDGANVATQFFYRSNASLAITARSLNDGVLLHEAGPDFGAIPYEAYVSGQPISTGDLTGVSLPGTAGAMQAGEMRVEVLPQEQERYSGRYRDTLTLTLTAN